MQDHRAGRKPFAKATVALHGLRRHLHEESQKLRALRHSRRSMLVWPALCLLVGALMWAVTLSKLRADQAALRVAAERQAATLANNYAEQLARSVDQLDRITLNIKYHWENNRSSLNLADQQRHGLLPASSQVYVSIFDRGGIFVTSTTLNGKSNDLDGQDWFRHLRTAPVDRLLIVAPEYSTRLGKWLMRFVRPLASADGAFDGIVSVGVEPAYIASLADRGGLGRSDFIALADGDGRILAASSTDDANLFGDMLQVPLAMPTAAGVVSQEPPDFADAQPRIVAWKKLGAYPLAAVAGLSESGLLAAHDLIRRDYRDLALAGSVLLALAALVGVFFSARLAWRKQQTEELRNAYHLAIDGAREGFYMVRAVYGHGRGHDGGIVDFVIEDCNERGAALVGRTKNELVGMPFSKLFEGAHAEKVMSEFCRAMELGFVEEELQVSPASPVQLNWINRKLVRSGGGLAMTVRDISDAKQQQQALSDLANTDVLTGLPNRHWLMHALPAALERAQAGGATLALLFVDLDDFKNINDALGHAAGDELLRAAAGRLRLAIRPSDHVVRLGGDEFTVVLDRVRGREDVSAVVERVIHALSEPFVLADGSSYTVHGSVGVSLYPQDGGDAKTLLKHADIAMYAAKAEGKGQYQFFRSQLSDRLVMRFKKEQALRRAIERDEFVLYYQPRVDTASGELRGLEALVRWTPAEGGVVPPLEFIPLAEDAGLIGRLGELVIDKACAQLAQWQALGLRPAPVSINVSAIQFKQGDVGAQLRARTVQHRIDPALIEIEITESSMMSEGEAVIRQLGAIEAMGIKLAIDDFGTGYSSLSQLQSLRFDVLKVDRAFTAQICNGREGEAFFMAIVSMAHVLGMRVVAEGVETLGQLHALQALSCNEVQGYLVAPPLPAADIPALLTRCFLLPQAATAPAAGS